MDGAERREKVEVQMNDGAVKVKVKESLVTNENCFLLLLLLIFA